MRIFNTKNVTTISSNHYKDVNQNMENYLLGMIGIFALIGLATIMNIM